MGGNYHKDFLIKMGGHEDITDTYYFWNEKFETLEDPYEGLFGAIESYFENFVVHLKIMDINGEAFAPVDLSDQYIGGFKVKALSDSFDISYGYIDDIGGFNVSLFSDDVYTRFNDQRMDLVKSCNMKKEVFYNSLKPIRDNRFFN
jgi:hypothetical protein